MTIEHPIADMLTRVRNAQLVRHPVVEMSSSNLKAAIADVLKREGYIEDYRIEGQLPNLKLKVQLKYFRGKPVISSIKGVSRSGLRIYSPSQKLPKIRGGLGIAIISTSKGLLTDREARNLGVGGEILCYVE